MERDKTRRCSNYPKADWFLFRKCLDNCINAVLSVGSLSIRLEALCNFLDRVEAEAVLIKVDPQMRDPLTKSQTETAYAETQ